MCQLSVRFVDVRDVHCLVLPAQVVLCMLLWFMHYHATELTLTVRRIILVHSFDTSV